MRPLARFACTIAFVVVGTYTMIAIAVALFIVRGTLTPGDVMFYDSTTPTLRQTLQFIGAGALLSAGLAFARHKLSPRRPA